MAKTAAEDLLTPPIPEAEAEGQTAALYDEVRLRRGGRVFGQYRMMARAPQLVRDALDLQDQHLHADDGVLDAKTREAIALGVSVANGCEDCVRSHAVKAKRIGWSEDDVTAILGLVAECAMLNAYHRHRELDASLGLSAESGLSFSLIEDPPIDRLTAELILTVVSGINACPACATFHAQQCRKLGASDEQLREAVRVGAAMSAFNMYFRIQG
ncbi:MAG: carboxymuconolactone decarboxylase family protein [Planctomycetota bacterium]